MLCCHDVPNAIAVTARNSEVPDSWMCGPNLNFRRRSFLVKGFNCNLRLCNDRGRGAHYVGQER